MFNIKIIFMSDLLLNRSKFEYVYFNFNTYQKQFVLNNLILQALKSQLYIIMNNINLLYTKTRVAG